MGTATISVGFKLLEFDAVSSALMIIAAVSYGTLWALFIWRAISFRTEFVSDMRNPEKVFAFFMIVAGTDVLAVRLLMENSYHIAIPLVLVPRFCGLSLVTCCRGRS